MNWPSSVMMLTNVWKTKIAKKPKTFFCSAATLPRKKAHERVFPFSRSTGWRIVKKYMTLANLSGSKACHKALRHTYAISYLLEKTPITTVKKWLDHENLKNTAIYLDIVNGEEYNEAQKIWPDMRDLGK